MHVCVYVHWASAVKGGEGEGSNSRVPLCRELKLRANTGLVLMVFPFTLRFSQGSDSFKVTSCPGVNWAYILGQSDPDPDPNILSHRCTSLAIDILQELG